MHRLETSLVLCALLIPSTVPAAMPWALPPYEPDANADRVSIPEVYRWRVADLYPDDDAWTVAFEAADAAVGELAAAHATLGDPAGLASWLGRYFDLELEINRLKLYASLEQATDGTNQQFIARHQRALALTNRIMDEGGTFRAVILGLSDDDLAAAYVAAPELERFRAAIDALRRRAGRVLEPRAERLLAQAGDNLWAAIDLNELPSPYEQTYIALQSEMPLPKITDETGREVQLTLSSYVRYRASADRRVRRDSVAGLFGTLRHLENTFASTLAGQVQFSWFLARARGYESTLAAYLDKDELEEAVYRNLIDTVRAHLPALHRYVALRRQVMDLDKVHLYDLYVPLVTGVDREIPYPEGAGMIVDALAPLGGTYQGTVRELLDSATGCIDLYPSRTKESGAFSASVYGVHPFIKMNYQDRFDDVSTLAHELGHAVHSHLSNLHQPYLTSRYVPFLAEVASTCNEMLLSKHVIANATSEAERAWLLSELAEGIRTTVYRQTLFAEFELEVHRLAEAGEPITADRLNSIYGDLIRDYYGPDYALDVDDELEWAYIPHLYYKYYVFVYATGMSSGIAIAERIAGGEPGAREAYLEMLSAGNSKPPLELLEGAGVDLRQPAAIAAALELFGRTVDELSDIVSD